MFGVRGVEGVCSAYWGVWLTEFAEFIFTSPEGSEGERKWWVFALPLAFNLSCRMERLFKSSITRKCPPQRSAEELRDARTGGWVLDSTPRHLLLLHLSAWGICRRTEADRVTGSPPWKISTCCKSFNIPAGINGVTEAIVLFLLTVIARIFGKLLLEDLPHLTVPSLTPHNGSLQPHCWFSAPKIHLAPRRHFLNVHFGSRAVFYQLRCASLISWGSNWQSNLRQDSCLNDLLWRNLRTSSTGRFTEVQTCG